MAEAQNSPVYSKRDVDYRDGELPEVCGNCMHFVKPEGFSLFSSSSCQIVTGRIQSKGVCNLWTPNEDVQEED